MRYLWIVGLSIYVGVVWYLGWQRVGSALASVNLKMLLAAAAASALMLWFRSAKWRLALGRDSNAVALYFISKAGGGMSPGRVGEFAPLLLRKHRTTRVGAWIVIDRLLEGFATIGLGLVGLVWLGIPEQRMAITFGAAMVVLVVIPLFVLTRDKLFLRMVDKTPEGSLRHRVVSLMARTSAEIRCLGTVIPAALVITVLATCGDLVFVILLWGALGYQVGFALLAVAQCAHGITSVLPFAPNATGIPYLVVASLLYEFAGVPEAVLAAGMGLSIAITGVIFWTSFLFGARDLKSRSTAAEDQSRLFDFLVAGSRLYVYGAESLEKLKALVPDKGRVLDLGCGDGAIGQALDGDWVVGVDISPKCAALAVSRGLNALVADARRSLPFHDETFDTVYCVNILHHLPGLWDQVIGELDRVLRRGGTMAIVEPDARYAFVRWTMAPRSPIRVAPCSNEPAIYAHTLIPYLERRGYAIDCKPIRIVGDQVERCVFPMWQRLLKAPFVILLAGLHGRRPNKFSIVARKPAS